MTQAALIILDEDRPDVPVLGLSWPEFQLRRAVRAGALHLVLVSDRVTRDVVEAVDRLRHEGLSTTLARSNAEVADLFHPDEAVLLLTGRQIVGDTRLADLLQATRPTLLCVDAEHAGPAHELIDARSHWIGIGRVDGAQIRATVPLTRDWDLGSTLLRKAVAARAARVMIGDDDVLLSATDAAGAARALVAAVRETPRGWGARLIVAPLARLVARHFPVVLPTLARAGQWAAIVGFALSAVVQFLQWTPAALAVFLSSILLAATSGLASAVTGIPRRRAQLCAQARDVAGVMLLGLLAVRALPDIAPAILALNIVALTALADRLVTADGDGTSLGWLADAAGGAVILGAGSLFGAPGLLVALAAITLHGFASVAILQNRLSRALTSPR